MKCKELCSIDIDEHVFNCTKVNDVLLGVNLINSAHWSTYTLQQCYLISIISEGCALIPLVLEPSIIGVGSIALLERMFTKSAISEPLSLIILITPCNLLNHPSDGIHHLANPSTFRIGRRWSQVSKLDNIAQLVDSGAVREFSRHYHGVHHRLQVGKLLAEKLREFFNGDIIVISRKTQNVGFYVVVSQHLAVAIDQAPSNGVVERFHGLGPQIERNKFAFADKLETFGGDGVDRRHQFLEPCDDSLSSEVGVGENDIVGHFDEHRVQ